MLTCSKCGHDNVGQPLFCLECGISLASAGHHWVARLADGLAILVWTVLIGGLIFAFGACLAIAEDCSDSVSESCGRVVPIGGTLVMGFSLVLALLLFVGRQIVLLADRGDRLRWWWSVGPALPLLPIVTLAAAMAFLVIRGGDAPREEFVAVSGPAGFPVASPQYYGEENFWLVRLDSGEFLALDDSGPATGCHVGWFSDYKFMDRTGWFVDSCNGNAFDLTGRCFDGMFCYGLGRWAVGSRGADVVVRWGEYLAAGLTDTAFPPVNPPQQ